jgi:hypothetical protein
LHAVAPSNAANAAAALNFFMWYITLFSPGP